MPKYENFLTGEELEQIELRIREILQLEQQIRELKVKKMMLNVKLMKETKFAKLPPKYRKQLWADVRREVGLK